ncbi:MAG: AraC family transcriptional regulator [Thermomicrobiales bacterium]|nr:AraC family transcriptional regulator [Thermomicrobiales bacterium]MCO5222052.1 AraC family transcriptional regulator [Thermomicrobiales bacterium]
MTRRVRVIPTNLVGVNAVTAQTNHAFGRHIHEQFGVGVIEHGAQTSLSGRGIVEAGAGDTISVNPGEVHDGIPIDGRARTWRMLYFDPELVLDAASDIGAGKGPRDEFAYPVRSDALLAAKTRALFDTITRPDPIAPALRQHELMLDVFAQLLDGQPTSPSPGIPGAFIRLRAWIADDPAAPLSLEDLAIESGLSRFQVVRGFSKAFGLTPHAYLVQCRINLARRLIESGHPLAESAFASGFADQSHMTRHFVRQFGVPLGAFSRTRQ